MTKREVRNEMLQREIRRFVNNAPNKRYLIVHKTACSNNYIWDSDDAVSDECTSCYVIAYKDDKGNVTFTGNNYV